KTASGVRSSRGDVARLAVVESPESRLGIGASREEPRDLLSRLPLAVVGQLEGAVMDCHAGRRAEALVCGEGFLRRHVDGAHEPDRFVGADWKQRQPDVRELLPGLPEVRSVTGIAREVDRPAAACQNETGPERVVAVEGA